MRTPNHGPWLLRKCFDSPSGNSDRWELSGMVVVTVQCNEKRAATPAPAISGNGIFQMYLVVQPYWQLTRAENREGDPKRKKERKRVKESKTEEVSKIVSSPKRALFGVGTRFRDASELV